VKNRLAELRDERRWTQVDLAERTGVSRQTIISIEKGKYDPSLPLAFKIADAFELPLEQIFLPARELGRSTADLNG
jgi:putative transcriptional regulator